MTTATDFQDYVNNTNELGAQALLGHIVLFKVGSNAFMPHADAVRKATKYGLEKFLPTNPPTDVDRIRTAFTNGEHGTENTVVPDGSGGYKPVKDKLLIRTVRNEATRLVKRVVVERVDENEERLYYGEAWEILFNGTNLALTQIDNDAPTTAGNLAQRLAEKYRRTRGCIAPAGFQNLILEVLAKADAFNVSRAAYFVPQEAVVSLQALEDFVADIPEVRVNSFPLANTPKQQEFIATAAAEAIQDEADLLMASMATYLQGDVVGIRRRTSFSVEVVELEDKIKHYVEMLEDASMLQKIQLKGLRAQLSAIDDRLAKEN